MKKIFLLTFLLILSIHTTFSYDLNNEDKEKISKAKNILWELTKTKDKVFFEETLIKVNKISLKVKNNLKNWTIVNEIKNELQNIIYYLNPITTQENSINSNNFEKEFFKKYGKNITTKLKIDERCIKHYDYIDKIAQKNNFPTALIIATWSKESNCGFSNPANGWGPFQITSHYYKPGNITLEDLGDSIENFIDFSKNKWNYFNTNTYVDYKKRFGSENLNISYSNYTLRELQIHSILYNGVSKSTTLETNGFANNNLNSKITSNSDGIVTRFLKILNWKIENNK